MTPDSRRRGMMHLNNHVLCAVDCETTGTKPGHHDIYQVCVLPLDADIRPDKGILPFYCDMKLKRPENIDPDVYKRHKKQICKAQLDGLDPDVAADRFDEWVNRLGLRYRKQIMPLAQNWVFDRGFMIDWLGELSFRDYFSVLYRDTMATALYCNDRADHRNSLPVPFSHHNLTWLARTYNIPHERAHDALQDCLVTAEVYRQMCKRIE